MANMEKRRLKAAMGSNFEDWANGYFSLESGHLDVELPRDDVFADYIRFANINRITMQSFTKKLKNFVKLCPWVDILNPPEMCNSSGRIQKAVTLATGGVKTKDMIYLRSLKKDSSDAKKMQTDLFDPDDDRPF